jgi:hypothetical protein
MTTNYNELKVECIICFHDINKSKNLKFCTTCGSNYHKKCINNWWKKSPDCKNVCPTCQTKSIYIQRKFYCCF